MATTNNNKGNTINNKRFGVDTLLTVAGKQIGPGQEVRFVLVKGPGPTNTIAAVAAGGEGYNATYQQHQGQPDPVNPKAPYEHFPLVAKFPESVVTPDLNRPPWNEARLYQQDTPKIQDDSDEEVTEKEKPRKRWRPRRQDPPKRQWILQNQVEFLESMMAKRQKRNKPDGQEDSPNQEDTESLSTRYEGVPEHNPSQYILLEQQKQPSEASDNSHIQVTILPTPNATVTFSQPHSRKTLSMSEAETAIADQRGKMTRFMMHDKKAILRGTNSSSAASESRKRLFGKLTNSKKSGGGSDEEEEDVMGDIAFRNRKGGGRARKELLNTLGDSGIKVDQDGVLGGNNDSEFGRGQRFDRFNAANKDNKDGATDGQDGGGDGDNQGVTKSSEGASGADTKAGFDGLAMADDFYQRDVGAEYEELDYDANEQFDDDDVDVGETEVATEGAGFAGGDADDDEDSIDDDDREGEGQEGPQGLANLAMFRVLLAKARGEITKEQAEEAVEAHEANKARRQSALDRLASKDESMDPLAKILEAAAAQKKKAEEEAAGANGGSTAANGTDANGDVVMADAAGDGAAAEQLPPAPTIFSQQVDENGLRIISLESVRREIWLNHGRMPTKRLMKIFGTKSNKARQNKFREVVKELCTMENDPVAGKMFVLKQHYSNMG